MSKKATRDDGVIDRRDFLGAMAASVALAGTTLGGCVRKPKERILPYSKRPEDLVPGRPRYYATVTAAASSAIGLLVESQDGRPTKVEGNPTHPFSRGATDAFAQASVIDLYSPDRPRRTRIAGKSISARKRDRQLAKLSTRLRGDLDQAMRGAGLGILIQDVNSPTFHRLLRSCKTMLPQCRIFMHDNTASHNARAAAKLVGLPQNRALLHLDKADRILTLDADILGLEGDTVRNTRQFAERRQQIDGNADQMNRLYVVEPAFTVTGMNADNRRCIPRSQIGSFATALLRYLAQRMPLTAGADKLIAKFDAAKSASKADTKWIRAVGDDLLRHRGRSVVVAGRTQSPTVHVIAHLLNALCGAFGKTIELLPDPLAIATAPLNECTKALNAGKLDTLVIVGGNPAYDAPADLDFAKSMGNANQVIHLTATHNETSKRAHWVIPQSHYLEAWSDQRATDGTVAIQQPLIAPLHESLSDIELIAKLLGTGVVNAYDMVRQTNIQTTSATTWRRILRDGIVPGGSKPESLHTKIDWAHAADEIGNVTAPQPTKQALELVLQLDASVLDGRFAHNPWLQELPDPVTKLVWDNALLVSPSTAAALNIVSEQRCQIETAGRSLTAAVLVVPGVAENCLALALGYGRSASGNVANDHGFNACRVRIGDSWFMPNTKIAPQSSSYRFARTQTQDTLTEPNLGGRTGKTRAIAKQTTVAEFVKHPDFAQQGHRAGIRHTSAQTPHASPMPTPPDTPQWGMVVDLNACIGCNACVAACQAENNIPVVGKARVRDGRHMHWLRIDRYFDANSKTPRVLHMPLACTHCETAPCESGCPVTATVHSPDGLNDMVYNRCIGARFCANNCPYAVRRFNFFDYQRENNAANSLRPMQMNPDVTVRARGVVEKCTYCVQRISAAKVAMKVNGQSHIVDGAVTPACMQACPAGAIIFGNIRDSKSRVTQQKHNKRNYEAITELGLRARTTYLAKVFNPNPRLT